MSVWKVSTLITDDFIVLDSGNNRITGIAPEAFTVKLYDPTGSEVSGTVTVTIVELAQGNYRLSFTPTSTGDWKIDIAHATYFPEGQHQNYPVFNENIDTLTDVKGTGFSTSTDSLKKIRDKMG